MNNIERASIAYSTKSMLAFFAYAHAPVFVLFEWGWWASFICLGYLILDWLKLKFLFSGLEKTKFLSVWIGVNLTVCYLLGIAYFYYIEYSKEYADKQNDDIGLSFFLVIYLLFTIISMTSGGFYAFKHHEKYR